MSLVWLIKQTNKKRTGHLEPVLGSVLCPHLAELGPVVGEITVHCAQDNPVREALLPQCLCTHQASSPCAEGSAVRTHAPAQPAPPWPMGPTTDLHPQ